MQIRNYDVLQLATQRKYENLITFVKIYHKVKFILQVQNSVKINPITPRHAISSLSAEWLINDQNMHDLMRLKIIAHS
jgi:hypothetical protein